MYGWYWSATIPWKVPTGVPAFQPPEARNAATTLAVMSVILGTLFIGITFLANGYGLIPNDETTIIAQSAEAVYGAGSVGFFLFLTFTTLILVLAANTSFSAFPRLSAVLAADRGLNQGFDHYDADFRGPYPVYTASQRPLAEKFAATRRRADRVTDLAGG
mgnify:CR=1 FL=1